MKKLFKILKWATIAIVAGFILLVISRIPWAIKDNKADAQIEKIHATKLTMDDVMGVNLPTVPGAEADKTIAGIDANKNGIRDDVELAIFKEYPDSAKTRAVLLQYALALQMDTVQPFENTRTATEVSREQSRAYDCVSQSALGLVDHDAYIKEADKRTAFVGTRQRNTLERKEARVIFAEQIRSYSESDNEVCDINPSDLPN